MVLVYGEVDIEGLDKDAGRAGTEGGSEEGVGTVDDVAAVIDGSNDGGGAEGCEPARSHGLGGDAITVANKMSREFKSVAVITSTSAPSHCQLLTVSASRKIGHSKGGRTNLPVRFPRSLRL